MHRIAVVYRRDVGRLLRNSAFRILAVVHGALSVGAGVGIGIALTRVSRRITAAGAPDATAIMRELVGAIVPGMAGLLTVCLAYLILCWVLAGPLMTEEKASGTLASLLATPLEPFELWVGKSLAVFVPGTVMALAGYVVLVGGAEIWASIATRASLLVVPSAALVGGLFGAPLLLLELILLTVWCAIALSPDAAVIPSLFLGFAILAGVPLGGQLWNLRFDSWSVTAAVLIADAFFAAALLLLGRFLGKERVVRSI